MESLKHTSTMIVQSSRHSRSGSHDQEDSMYRQEYYHKKLGHISFANPNFIGKNSKYKTQKRASEGRSFVLQGFFNQISSDKSPATTVVHGEQIKRPSENMKDVMDQGTQ